MAGKYSVAERGHQAFRDQVERLKAIALKRRQAFRAKVFQGRRCVKCHATIRWKANRRCVRCDLKVGRADIARGLGLKHYDSGPCRSCGATLRYPLTARCVVCCRARAAAWYRKHSRRLKAERRKAAAATAAKLAARRERDRAALQRSHAAHGITPEDFRP